MNVRLRPRVAGFAVSSAVLLGSLLGTAPVQAEPPPETWSGEVTPARAAQHAEEVRAFAHDTGMSVASAEDYFRLGATVDLIDRAARARFGPTFAGVWRDPADSVTPVHVAFVGDAAAKTAALRAGTDHPEAIRAVEARSTLAELDDLTARVARDRMAWARRGVAITQAMSDVTRNAVVVTVPGLTPTGAAALGEAYGSGLVVEDAPPMHFADLATCVDRMHCVNVMRGGIDSIAQTGNGVYECTTGFTAHQGPNLPDRVLTAGHCFGTNATVSHNGVVIGTVSGRQLSGSVDGEQYTIQPPPVWYDMNWVYYNDTTKEYYIEHIAGRDATEGIGTPVCHSGITTGVKCGTVKSTTAMVTLGGTPLTGQHVASGCALPGDSGGPIIYNTVAFGVVSGSNFTTVGGVPTCAAAPTYSYSSLVQTENALNIRVKTT